MAGQARRSTQGPAGSSPAVSSASVRATASVAESGSGTVATSPRTSQVSTPGLPTRTTYRTLIMRGLTPDEAANLTAYLTGIDVAESHWTLRQINQLLFLRQMNRTGHFSQAKDRID